MKYLITGSCGFIGYSTCKDLLNKGFKVVGIDNLNNYYDSSLKISRKRDLEKYKNFYFLEADLENISELKIPNIDIVIHLAAQAGVRGGPNLIDGYIKDNITCFLEILNFTVAREIKFFIFASSSSVYSDINTVPFLEDDKKYKPQTVYGLTKRLNENIAHIYAKKYALNALGLRFFTVYGDFGRPDMAYYNFTERILNKETIILNNKGNIYRDMTHIDDIVNGINLSVRHIANQNKNFFDVFNLGSGKPIRIKDLLDILVKEVGYDTTKIKHKSVEEVLKTHASLVKSKKILGYEPKKEFNVAIKQFCVWLKEHKNI
tara:strand:- start:16585 stop:17538 length:954 start_codon:yes stop_codon:yes gene_type:complete